MPILTVGNPRTIYMVVDSEAMFHRAYHAFTSDKICLRTSTGALSGGFHGFFSMLYNQVQSFSPKEMIFCWGDKRANLLRRNIYPAYKGNRSDTPRERFDEQLFDVQLVLDVMGFVQYTSQGYEGDDVIATVVKDRLQPYLDSDPTAVIAILSSDKDMLQLVNNRVTVYHVASSIPTEFTPAKVEEKYGVTPALFADYLCLVGDDNDNEVVIIDFFDKDVGLTKCDTYIDFPGNSKSAAKKSPNEVYEFILSRICKEHNLYK